MQVFCWAHLFWFPGKTAACSLHLVKEVPGVLDNIVAAMVEAWNAERGLPDGIQNARADDPDKSVRRVGSCIIRGGSVASPICSLWLPNMQPWRQPSQLASVQATACQYLSE